MSAALASRIASTFGNVRHKHRKAFIAYITAGDPGPALTADLILALAAAGTDVIELGVPFSDPIADGPVIQRASERALQAGTKMADVLQIVRDVRRQSAVPIVLFSYLNPLLRYGLERLAGDASAAGVDGVLLTDLSVEKAQASVSALRRHSLDTIFLAAPTSTESRLRLVAEHSSGFVYLVSRTGVTGEQSSFSHLAQPLIERMRRLTHLPLALGFGISTPEQVKEAAELADGVVVGSAIVRCIAAHSSNPNLCSELERFTRRLTAPLREP